MGRDPGTRVKSRPSSSSQAAAMIQQTSGVNIGFGGYVGSSRVAGAQADDAYLNIDGESAANLRRLSKKDTTTKLKALSALNTSFRELSVTEILTLLPCWVFEYKRLVHDNSRQIREATHKAMLTIVITIGRSLAPHLKSLIGPWWVAHFDPFAEVSEAAKQAFQASFTEPKKRLEALTFCASEILAHIDENLKLTPQTISDKSTPIDESTEKYERVIATTLLALAALLDVLLSSDTENNSQKDYSGKLASLKATAIDIFQARNQFQGFFKAGSSRIRSAAYQAMQAYIKCAQEVVTEHLDSVAKAVLGALGEKDPACHQAMWDMILCFSRSYDRAWEGPGLRKSVYPRLWSFLRHACYGSLNISYPCILPLLSLIPATAVQPTEGFFTEFFKNLWSGCEEGMWSDDDGTLLLNTMKECLLWVVKHSQRYTSSETTDANQLQVFVVETVCLRLLYRTYTGAGSSENDQKKSSLLRSSEFIDRIGSTTVHLLKSLDTHLLEPFWISLREECSTVIHQSEDTPVARMAQFLVLLKKENVDVSSSVVKPFIMKEFLFIKESERPDALKLLSQLASSYGPSAFGSLASSSWGMTPEQAQDTDELSGTFTIKYLQYFFRKELVPWCLGGDVNELKLDLLLSFLQHDDFIRDWEFVVSLLSETSVHVDFLATVLRKVQERFQDVDRWRSSKIDEAVLAVASNSELSVCSRSTLIRSCLLGVKTEMGYKFILSNDAVAKLLEKVLETVGSSANISTNSLASVLLATCIPDVVQTAKPATFQAAGSAIDIVLSSYPAIRTLDECSDTLAKVFASIFCLYWAYMLSAIDPSNDGDEIITEAISGFEETGEAVLVVALATARQTMPAICKDLSTACWRSMQDLLISTIRQTVVETTDVEMHKTGAAWVLDQLSSTCRDSEQRQEMLDLLLAANNYWPIHLEAHAESPTEVERHRRFCSMIHQVGLGTGLEALVLGSSQPEEAGFRPWLIIELLCTWKWVGGSANEFVLPFLQACANSDESGCLVDKVLEELFHKASTGVEASKLKLYCCWRSKLSHLDGYLRSLLTILGALFGNDGQPGKLNSEKLFHRYLSSAPGFSAFIKPCVLDILMPSLRKKSTTIESAVCIWLRRALDVPPLSTADIAPDDVQCIQIAVACFPVDINGGVTALLRASGAEVSQDERDGLLRLLQKQYPTGKPTAEATADRGSTFDEVRQMALAKLMAAAICYCWESLGNEEWSFILCQLRRSLQKGVIDAEEFTESIAEGSLENLRHCENSLSLELLGTTVNVLSLAKALQSLEKAADSHSLRSLAEAQWQSFDARATDNVLRLLLATGLAEAVADAHSAVEKVSIQRIEHSYLWEQVANIALSASDRVRDAAVRAANLWGLEKTAISGLYALMFSPYPLASLQWISFKFLSTDPLQHQAITWNLAAPREDTEADEEKAPVSDDIRPELRVVLETPASVLLETPLSSSRRVHYFLAWSLFVTHFQSLGTTSQAKDRLLQFTHDSDGPSILLDCLIQHIGLKRVVKKKDVIGSAAVAEAANRAAGTGSVSFAVEALWGGGKDELAILAGALYGFLLRVLPARVRRWYTDLRDKNMLTAVEIFTTTYCSTQLLKEEFTQVQAAALSDENLTIVTNTKLQEVTATYKKEETGMDMVIKFPTCYPLKSVEVECTRRLGITETLLRKWILSIVSFLRNQNGAVAEAVMIWKKNVDHEFEGVEECPICYSILHTTNHGLPRLACKTCRHKFHAACLYKWFSSSHKSNCPLCQTPF